MLAHGGSYPPEAGITVPIRQLAGYVLKNYTFQDKATISNPQLLPTVKADLLVSLGDSTDDIRNTAAALLCHLATQLELPLWADILQGLLSNIANGIASPTVSMFGAVSALSLICEDCSVTISENLSVLEAVTATLQPAALCSNDGIICKILIPAIYIARSLNNVFDSCSDQSQGGRSDEYTALLYAFSVKLVVPGLHFCRSLPYKPSNSFDK